MGAPSVCQGRAKRGGAGISRADSCLVESEDGKQVIMDHELFALRQEVYATAADYHGALAAYTRAQRGGEDAAQAYDATTIAAASYRMALEALEQYLTTAEPTVARAGEVARLQQIRAVLHEELALLRGE